MEEQKLCLGISDSFDIPYEEQVTLFKKVGFDGFFYEMQTPERTRELKRCADSNGMYFQSVHARFTKMADIWKGGDKAREASDELLECLYSCAENSIPIMVCHAFIGFNDHTPTAEGIEEFSRVVKKAEELGIRIAMENTEGEEYLDAVMRAFWDSEAIGFCIDSGHELCYNCGKDMLSLYGKKLAATHINDNLGVSSEDGEITWLDDLHLLPFDGRVDFEDLAWRFKKCGYIGPLTFELTRDSKPGRHENDSYKAMDIEKYLSLAYEKAAKFAHMCK